MWVQSLPCLLLDHPGDELVPTILQRLVDEDGVGIYPGRSYLSWEMHPGFWWCASRFMMIAGDAGANHIFPGMSSTTGARHYVVQGELLCFTAAIKAGIVVP